MAVDRLAPQRLSGGLISRRSFKDPPQHDHAVSLHGALIGEPDAGGVNARLNSTTALAPLALTSGVPQQG